MRSVLLICIYLSLVHEDVSLRLSELRVPSQVPEGGSVLLGCQFQLEGDQLYSVTWYKDDQQFYRYLHHDKNTHQYRVPGIQVDMSRSSADTVWLRNVSAAASGDYRCEVRGEAPGFAGVADSKHVSVYLLPDSDPVITGRKEHYKIGEVVNLHCKSAVSRPATQLRWWVNDEVASAELLGDTRVVPAAGNAGAFVTELGLRFRVSSRHFKQGAMKLKCDATIAPMYNNEAIVKVKSPVLETSYDDVSHELGPEVDSHDPFSKHSHNMFYDPDDGPTLFDYGNGEKSGAVTGVQYDFKSTIKIILIILIFGRRNF